MNQTYLLSVVLIAFAVVPAGCRAESPEGTPAGATAKGSPSSTATRVEVAALAPSTSMVSMVRPGEVNGAREAQLGSALGGFVERVVVETGQTVKKNAPLVYVDTSIHSAQATLTKLEIEEAERELARVERLGKAIATSRVDTARSRLARAQAQHSLSTTRQSRAVIRAPFDGVVVGLDVERGEVLAPGAPIARVIQLDPLHVSVSVTDRDVAALSEGIGALVRATASPEPIAGKIHRIEPAANLMTRTFLIEVEIANPERRLLPGMIAHVAFESVQGANTLHIPQDFLVTRLAGNGVFVAEESGGKEVARWRTVELGPVIGKSVEVKAGIAAGARIVVLGHRGLSDGDELLISREGHCCTAGRVTFEPEGAPARSELEAAAKPVPDASDEKKETAQ